MDPSILRERLRGIVAPGPASPERGLEVRDPVATVEGGRPAAGSLEHALGGTWRTGEHGRTFVVERRVAAATRYGAATVGDLAGMIGSAAAAAPMLANGPVRPPFIFFDLETTGLSGGAGTVAFLVGRGWFDESGAFVTEQHLLVSAASERAMLQNLAHDIASVGALVTFNGKSFDAPVLDTRYLFHR